MAVTLNQQQLASLKASFTTGPLAVEIAPLLHVNPTAIAALYASLSSIGAGNVSKAFANKSDVVLVIETAVVNLQVAAAAIQQKWEAIAPLLIQLLGMADSQILKADVTSLSALVADSLITQAQADAPWLRIGGYCEVLLGENVFPTSDDIQAATELA